MKRPVLLAPLLALSLAACGGQTAASPEGADGEALRVLASFYPLQFVTERVGGDRVEVSSLTPPGAEPHDLELTPRDVAAVSEADLVVLLEGFQPAVDEAVDQQAADRHLDVSAAADLDVPAADDGHGHDDAQPSSDGDAHLDGNAHADEEAHADEDGHADDDAHADEDGHADEQTHADEDRNATEDGPADPHFWLDPTRLADVADAVAERLAEADPAGAEVFAAGAEELRADLEALDTEFSEGLAQCASTDLVVSHEAFGYLAQRYGLDQVGIAGLSPDSEPQPGALARVADEVRERGVTTIFSETLVSPALAETVAAETGATTAVLDPLEGLTDESAGDDYFAVMRANLDALQTGLTCT